MTVGEVHERITELDALIFKVETGQVSMTWEEYRTLQVEAESLMEVWAQNVSSAKVSTFEKAFELRQKMRTLDRLTAITERHLELHPEDIGKENQNLIATFQSGEDGNQVALEAFKRYVNEFNYLFENCPKPPEEKTRGLLQRLFRR